MIRRRAVALATGLGLALLSGACAAPSPGTEVASIGAGESAAGTSTTAPARDPREAALEFARCMREHGVDIPDPEIGDDGGVGITLGSGADKVDAPAMRAAREACEPALDAAVKGSGKKMDPAEEARRREQALAFARCMREHGIDMPDPVFEADGMVKSKIREPGRAGPDPESPVFQDAMKACEDQVGMDGPGMKLKRDGAGGTERGRDAKEEGE